MIVRGESQKTKTCPDCGGAGEEHRPVQDGNRLRIAIEKCKTCYGTGKIPDGDGDDGDRGVVIIKTRSRILNPLSTSLKRWLT